MLTTSKAKATKLPDGMQVEVMSRNFKFYIDEPKHMGGLNEAMTPMEALLGTLGACQAIVAAAYAKAHKVSYKEFSVEIEGDMDMDGFMGKAGVRPGFQEIRYTMHFKTKESKETIEKFAKFIEQTCPITDTLKHEVTIVNAGVVID